MISFDDQLPIYVIFILMLIISAGYLPQILPCKVQRKLEENIYLKHIFGFLTLLFFVIITNPLESQNVLKTIPQTVILYFIFLLYAKTDYRFFFIITFISAILYILMLRKAELLKIVKDEKDENEKKRLTYTLEKIIIASNTIFIIIIFLIICGFLIYLGEKKIEYKDKFNYLTFILGKPYCGNIPQHIPIFKSIKYAFT